MKRIAVLLLCIMLAVVTYGQSNDRGKDVFVLVKVFSKTGNTTASVDFGDGTPVKVSGNEKGKARVFESNFEPMNLLIKDGWEIDNFSSLLNNFFTTTIWVMKKKTNTESDLKEGMVTKMKLIDGDK